MSTADKEPESLADELSRRQGRNWTPVIMWLVALIAMGGVCVCIFSSHLDSRRRRSGPICATNLRAIARACLVYADANEGHFPASLDVLTAVYSTNLKQEQLVCPVGGRPYVYVPNMRNTDDPGNVLVYDPLENHGGEGACVAYVDGHAKWQIGVCFRELLLKAQTQPAGGD
jgi:hypothetical protein